MIDGGTEVIYERPLKAGDRLFMTSTTTNLEVKESKGLGKMLVVTIEQTFTDSVEGDVVMRTYAQAIYY